MQFEEHLILNRSDIAARLHHLADQIAQGRISLGPLESPVAEQAEYEIEFEIEHGKRELKIEVEWR